MVFEENLFGTRPTARGKISKPASPPGPIAITSSSPPRRGIAGRPAAQSDFAFDTETNALGAMNSELVGMSFSWESHHGYYVPVPDPRDAILPCERVLAALRPILEDPAIGKVGHNIKYDLLVMRQAGITLRGIPACRMTSRSYFMLCPTLPITGSSRIGRSTASTRSHGKIAHPSGPRTGT